MSRFELFTMIFYALDSVWDESQNEELGQFLSNANPFLFEDTGSADPAVFDQFCNNVPDNIEISDSYNVAIRYISSLDNIAVKDAWTNISREDWDNAVNDYLSKPHKN